MTELSPVDTDRMISRTDSGDTATARQAFAHRASHKIADIEVLRAIAVMFVLVHHANGNLIMQSEVLNGIFKYVQLWPGVDLFFAISGFVIARSLLPILAACKTNAAFFKATLNFWIRRAWRLLPSAWLWLALMLLAPAVFNRSGVFGTVEDNFWAAVAGVLDFANFRFAYKWAHAQYYGTSFAYWSLSLEEQFYLLLPIAAFLFRRRLAVLLVILLLLQLFSSRSLMLMVVRTDAILLGVLLAMWSRQVSYKLIEPRGLAKNWLARLLVISVLLCCIAALGADKFTFAFYRIGTIAALSAVLVWIASYDRDYLCRPSFAKEWMVWIGARSYGLYLIHIPIYCLTREIWYRLAPSGAVSAGTLTLCLILTAVFLLLLLCELNYRFIELPLRAYGVRVAERFMQRP